MNGTWGKVFSGLILLGAVIPRPPRAQVGGAQNPSGPQKFQIESGQTAGFGFVVSQPGAIVITANWQGPPLTFTLSGSPSQPLTLTASGQAKLQYTVTPQDISRGQLWKLAIRLKEASHESESRSRVNEALPDLDANANVSKRASRPVLIHRGNAATLIRHVQVVAQGTVDLQHPPGDISHVAAQLNAVAAPQRAPLQAFQAPAARPAQSLLESRRAELVKLVADQQAARARELKSRLVLRQRPILGQDSGQPPNSEQPKEPSIKSAGRGVPVRGSQSASSTQPSHTVSAVYAGSSAGPTTASLSASEGQPGDPVLITGSNFGAAPGEVHFIVNPGMDLVAKIEANAWNDQQILAYVPGPEKGGILGFKGLIYVTSGGRKSNLVPFQFNPAVGSRQLYITYQDSSLDPWVLGTCKYDPSYGMVSHGVLNGIGHRGDDEFFLNKRLKNGWVADSINFDVDPAAVCGGSYIPGDAGRGNNAGVVDDRLGTDSPYVKVHWWVDGAWFGGQPVAYSLSVNIKGPLGVPYE